MVEVAHLVLADEADEVALWAVDRLRRHRAEVALVTPADVAFASELTYTWDGDVEHSRVELDDGRVIDSSQVGGVLNRFPAVYTEHWRRLGPQDAAYAEAEIHAACLVWLDSLGEVVTNPPSPYWLGGPYLRPQVWRALAARAGIPVAPVRETAGTLAVEVPDTGAPDESTGGSPAGSPAESPAYADQGLAELVPRLTSLRQLVVHRGEVFGDASPALADWGRSLADQVGIPLLGLDVGQTPDGAEVLADVTVHPDLRRGGEALIASLLRQWTARTPSRGRFVDGGAG
jgi:hypothetical protein